MLTMYHISQVYALPRIWFIHIPSPISHHDTVSWVTFLEATPLYLWCRFMAARGV